MDTNFTIIVKQQNVMRKQLFISTDNRFVIWASDEGGILCRDAHTGKFLWEIFLPCGELYSYPQLILDKENLFVFGIAESPDRRSQTPPMDNTLSVKSKEIRLFAGGPGSCKN